MYMIDSGFSPQGYTYFFIIFVQSERSSNFTRLYTLTLQGSRIGGGGDKGREQKQIIGAASMPF